MRVLHYVDENKLAWGETWIQLLHALQRRGAENLVVCKTGGTLAERLKEEGIAHDTCDIPFAQLPFTALKLGRLIDTFQPDLIHTRLSSAARTGGWWGRRKKIPVIQSVDKYPKAYYHKNADFLLPCSFSVRDYMLSLGFPAEKMQVLHNPVDAARYVPEHTVRDTMRVTLCTAEDQILITAAGRFVAWKGFDILLKAYAAFLREMPQMRDASRLLLAGDGEERGALLALIEQLGLKDNVLLPGFVADIRPYLWASDLFVLPSKTPEPFGIVLLEAMAAGLPCLATRAGGPLDIIRDGENGWLMDAGNDEILSRALERALAAPQDLKQIGKAAQAAASLFDVAPIAAQTMAIYERLAKNK